MSAADSQPGLENGSVDLAAALAEHRRWLRTVVLARQSDPHAADEIMQEVALAAIQQRTPLSDPSKASAWLYRVAVRQTLLYRRRQGRRRQRVNRYAEAYRPKDERSGDDDPLGWLLSDERIRVVREGLKNLSCRDRELLLLKYTEDWSYRQLARHLGVSCGAVESRLHRARQRLRRELSQLHANEEKP